MWFVYAPCYDRRMIRYGKSNAAVITNVLLLIGAAPILYFPNKFPPRFVYLGVGMLIAGVIVRKYSSGKFIEHTTADKVIGTILLVLLPLSIWSAPTPLRIQYAIPRSLILLWNIGFFYFIVTYTSSNRLSIRRSLYGYALCSVFLSIIGVSSLQWHYKYAGSYEILASISKVSMGRESIQGIVHPNQLAGTLVAMAPVMLVMWFRYSWQKRGVDRGSGVYVSSLFAIATIMSSLTILLTQSRAALIGLILGSAIIVVRGTRSLLAYAIMGCTALCIGVVQFMVLVRDNTTPQPFIRLVGGANSANFRLELWRQSLDAVRDFPITGIGFGTFRAVMPLFYPIDMSPDYDIGHAHNMFLQSALDWGILGLIIVIALFVLAYIQVLTVYCSIIGTDVVSQNSLRGSRTEASMQELSVVSLALLGGLVSITAFSLLDAVSMGSKTNFVLWWLLAMAYSIGNRYTQDRAYTMP